MQFFRQALLAFFILTTFVLNAITYTTISNGDWNSNSTWDANGKPGTYWGSGDQVIVNHDVSLNQNIGYAGTLTISASASLIGLRDISLNNGASITASGEVSIKKLTLNSSSDAIFSNELTLSNNLTVGSGSTIVIHDTVQISGKVDNNGGTITGNSLVDISGNLTNNNGTITFNGKASVGGKFDNNNSSAVININEDFDVSGNVTNNSGATINVASTADISIGGNLTNNSGSELNNEGKIDVEGNFANNGGTVNNDNIFLVDGNFTQNGGTFTNDGVMVVDGNFTVNGSGTVNGDGLIRTNDITNHGTISGSNDICRTDDSTPTTQSGGGSYSGSTSYCTESSSAALPIELVYFKGTLTDYGFQFMWQTATEINNDYFEIEYAPYTNFFSSLAKVEGAGNSTQTLNYSKQIPFSLASNGGYFRLKQTDFDGKYSYSNVIYLKEEQNKIQLKVYPNPSDGSKIYINLNLVNEPKVNLQLFNKVGQLIISKNVVPSQENSVSINLLGDQQLKAGIYFLKINGIATEKIIIQ